MKILTLLFCLFILSACTNRKPEGLDTIKNNARAPLAECPEQSPCLQSEDPHLPSYVAPIQYIQSRAEVKQLLKAIFQTLEMDIYYEDEEYISATHESSLLGLKSTYEFDFRRLKVMHIRATSHHEKFSQKDLKKKLEEIRFRFAQRNM